MIWVCALLLGVVIGLKGSAFLLVLTAGILGVCAALQAALTASGAFGLGLSATALAVSYNFGLAAGLAASYAAAKRR